MTNQNPVDKLIERVVARVDDYFLDINNLDDIVDNWPITRSAGRIEYVKCIVWTGNLYPSPASIPAQGISELSDANRLFFRNHLVSVYLEMELELHGLPLRFLGQDWFLDDLNLTRRQQ